MTNTSDVLSAATAEIAMLLLGAARRAAEGDRLVRDGRWTSWSPSFMVGQQVTGNWPSPTAGPVPFAAQVPTCL